MAVAGVSWTVMMNSDRRSQMGSSCTKTLGNMHGMVVPAHGM